MHKLVLGSLALPLVVFAQAPTAPVVNPRGVVNAYTQQPAPTSVAPGGVIWINGLNLSPAEGWKADGTPLPTAVGDPAIEVRLGTRALPLFSVSPGRIVAQIPADTPVGANQIVVRRGDQQSRPARFNITAPMPSVRSANGFGYAAAGTVSGNTLVLRATGLGPTNPAVDLGALPGADAPGVTPRVAVRANVGGNAAVATAKLSKDAVGEFEIAIELPPTAADGDVVNVYAGNSLGNRVTLNKLAQPKVDYLALPEAAGSVRGIAASDLRPGFAVVSNARDGDGCWTSFVVDFDARKAGALPGCYTAAAAQLPSPFTSAAEGNALGALVGPPAADAANGVSSKVALLTPGLDPREIDLVDKALTLGSAQNGNLAAILAGTPPRIAQINSETGEVTEGAFGGGGGGVFNFNNLTVDLGDGIKEVVSAPINLGQGMLAVLVADSTDKVTKARFAVVNAQGQASVTFDFPDGWLPLQAPVQPTTGGGFPGLPPGLPPGGGGTGLFSRFRTNVDFDAITRQIYVMSRKTDNSSDAFIRFPLAADQATEVLAFPANTFMASCTAQLRTFPLALSRRLAISTTDSAEDAVKNPCTATGFLTLDYMTRAIAVTPLPGFGQFNATGNSANEMNDFVYGANADAARQGRADTLYVFDGVTSSAFRLDLPPEIASFANLTEFAPMGILFGQATSMASRVAGDAGVVVFDLDNATSRLLPTPAGFATVQPLTIFPATRKLIARGTRADPAGTQILIYDLVTGDLQIIANPAGVAFAGALTPVPPTPGQPAVQQTPALQQLNAKGNAVTAVGFDANRRAVGVMLILVH